MSPDRQRYGLLISAVGAMVLAISVFLPWYGLSFTTAGIAFAQQLGNQVASQFGNATLQGYMSSLHSDLSGLAGHQFAAVSAHQVLKRINILLLLIAGLGALLALLPLARPQGASGSNESSLVALLGGLASVLVLYRMLVPPVPDSNLIAFSLREGAWGALFGSLAMIGGVFAPGRLRGPSTPELKLKESWSELSGWTPEA